MASTSGTIGAVTIDAIDIIERAVRRCRRLQGSIAAEDAYLGRQNLFFVMLDLINHGVPLWSIVKIVIGLNLNENLVVLPTSLIDIRNALYRYSVLPSGGIAYSSAGGNATAAFDGVGQTPCTQMSANGYISYNFLQQVTIPYVGFLNNQTETLNPIYEWSNDNVTWTELTYSSYAGGMPTTFGASTYEAAQWYWTDVGQPVNAQYFRIRETAGGTLNVLQVVFGQQANEITISRSNADDYQNLPNKNIVAGNQRPLQYWLDRQITPQMWIWPPAGFIMNPLVIWGRRQLQDVGEYYNAIECPQRWLNAIIWALAEALSHELQGINIQYIPVIAAKAQQALQLAWAEERDASPVMYTPQIRAYTRAGN